jgi:hypothetical protein
VRRSRPGEQVWKADPVEVGRQQWTSEFGTDAVDIALGVALHGHAIHVVGSTLGSLPGQTSTGSRDAFALTLG